MLRLKAMEKGPQVSIIIPTYQRAQLLSNAIASVLDQTYSDFQLCIYDNCSNDETQAVVEQFMIKDSRIKYHRHPSNLGMIANYQFSFEKINTPFFSFLSDDDILLPCFLETAVNDFIKYPDAGFVACDIHVLDYKGNVLRESLSEWQKEGYFPACTGLFEMIDPPKYPIPTGILFNRQLTKDIEPDWSEELQLLWDPDYLIQITSQFPIVINRKKCGYFIAHSEAFSTGFYGQLYSSSKSLKILACANKKMVTRLHQNPNLLPEVKKKTIRTLNEGYKRTGRYYMNYYLKGGKYRNFLHCFLICFVYYGFDRHVFKDIAREIKSKMSMFYHKIRSRLPRIRGKIRLRARLRRITSVISGKEN